MEDTSVETTASSDQRVGCWPVVLAPGPGCGVTGTWIVGDDPLLIVLPQFGMLLRRQK